MKNLFVVPLSVSHSLDGLVQVECSTIGIDINQLDREVGIFCVRGNVQSCFNKAADLYAFAKRFSGVNEYVVP